MRVVSRKDSKLIANLIVDGGYKYVSKFAIEDDEGIRIAEYDSIEALYENWEDYEEPKEYWFINSCGAVEVRNEEEQLAMADMHKKFGNYFETKEEAEKAVEKLKAWKRLKDNGFKFTTWKNGILLDEAVAGQVRYEFPIGNKDDIEKDLDLLFGTEKEG